MNAMRLLYSAIGTFARILGYCNILSAFLDQKRPSNVTKKIFPFLLYFTICIIAYMCWPYQGEILELAGGIIISIGVYLFYRAGFSKAVVGTVLAVSIERLADTILLLVVSVMRYLKMPAANTNTLWDFKNTVGIGVLFLALTKLFAVFFNRSMPRKELAMRMYRLGASTIPIVCMVGAIGTVRQIHRLQIDDINASSLLMAVFTLVVLTLLSFYLFGELKEGEYLKTEKQRMEQKQIEYAHELKAERRAYEKGQRLRHDMKNHIILLGGLAKQKDYEGLEAYISRLSTEMLRMNLYANSGNKELDSILNYKLSDAEEKGIEVEVSVMVPQDLGVEAFDLSVLLGNLLDNALEGAEECEKKKISVSIQFTHGVLYLTIKNTYDGIVQLDAAGNYRTTKKDIEQHGIGLTNIREVVEKYDGNMQIHSNSEVFTVGIMLYPNEQR